MDPVLSVFLRGLNYLPTSTDRLLVADELTVWSCVVFEKILKARTLRGLQYNTPEEKAEDGMCEIMSKCIAVFLTNVARVMSTKGNLVKEKELKNSLLDIESYVLNVTQKMIHENLTLFDKPEILSKLKEKLENCYKLLPSEHTNMHVSVLRDSIGGIFNMFLSTFNQTKETAEDQKISEIELD